MHVDPWYGRRRNFDAVVVQYDNIPDECTVYPADVEEDRQTTVWITAQEGSYFPASAMR
jgi:hypothetical protein